jgi:hypothetical protein
MKIKLISLFTFAAAVIFAGGVAAAQGQYVTGSTGVDVSWPNCSASVPKASFGIVGVTGGKAFTGNTCLRSEASNFGNLSLYINTAWPGQSYGLPYQNSPKACDPTNPNCLAYNYGYNAGLYALQYAQNQGVNSNTWWLDVETMNSWSGDTAQNINSLQGTIDSLRDATVGTVGVYSTTAQWTTITGGWKNLLPSWGATTWTTAKQAATYCHGHEFTGGPSYMMQFSPKRGLDQDYAC